MRSTTKDKSGFTIIEVLIVLAIAGLIMLIVFLAVPALQRSQRNNARKSDVSGLSAYIYNYRAQHNSNITPDAVENAESEVGFAFYGENDIIVQEDLSVWDGANLFAIIDEELLGNGSGSGCPAGYDNDVTCFNLNDSQYAGKIVAVFGYKCTDKADGKYGVTKLTGSTMLLYSLETGASNVRTAQCRNA